MLPEPRRDCIWLVQRLTILFLYAKASQEGREISEQQDPGLVWLSNSMRSTKYGTWCQSAAKSRVKGYQKTCDSWPISGAAMQIQNEFESLNDIIPTRSNYIFFSAVLPFRRHAGITRRLS